MNKIVCFAGHKDDWRCLGIKDKLFSTIEELINKGYTIFYDGDMGAFDKLCLECLICLKKKYPYIKIIRILAYYHENKEKYDLPSIFDDSIYPDLENCYKKAIITKRNEWIVNNSDLLVCHIENTFRSGAFKTVEYARKIH